MSEYVSTRGEESGRHYDDVLLAGQASDGGIFIPTELPEYGRDRLNELNQIREYPRLFTAVRGDFVGDSITLYEQQLLARRAYTEEKFPASRDGEFIPVRHIDGELYIQALSEGPTGAFKDMALQAVGQDMQYVLNKLDRHLRILGATSGDTGSSAEAAVKGLSRVSLFMLSPREGMYEFQKAQMAQLSGGNIHNIEADMKFDALQQMVIDMKQEDGFEDLGAVNSINWARVASQIPYYFSGYLQVIRSREDKKIGDEVDFVVPSGNMGNALAAYYAKRMGLPIRNIVVATNENDVLHRLIQSGTYEPPTDDAYTTSSPSMDIKRANNFERVIADLVRSEQSGEHDPERVREYMRTLRSQGHVSLSDIGLKQTALQSAGFDSGKSTHRDRSDAVRTVFSLTDGTDVIDSHTGDGVAVAMQLARRRGLDVPTICMETAKPVKVEPFTKEVLGFVPERVRDEFKDVEKYLKYPNAFIRLQAELGLAGLKDIIRSNSN